MKMAVTGHRPPKLGGYDEKIMHNLFLFACDVLKDVPKLELVITGMALGWDQAVAEAAMQLDIPFLAAVPFEGQESRWLEESREHYDHLLRHAIEVKVVSPGGYSAFSMHVRNEWMVDRACSFPIYRIYGRWQ